MMFVSLLFLLSTTVSGDYISDCSKPEIVCLDAAEGDFLKIGAAARDEIEPVESTTPVEFWCFTDDSALTSCVSGSVTQVPSTCTGKCPRGKFRVELPTTSGIKFGDRELKLKSKPVEGRIEFVLRKAENGDDASFCRNPEQLCLFEDGTLYNWAEDAEESGNIALEAGKNLIVHVFGCRGHPAGSIDSEISIQADAGTVATAARQAEPSATAPPPCGDTYVELESKEIQAGTIAAGKTFRVVFRPDPQVSDGVKKVAYAVHVNSAYFYVDAGLMFPFVVDGSRSVVQTSTPDGRGTTLRARTSNTILPAATLHVFPVGLRRGGVSFFNEHCKVRDGLCPDWRTALKDTLRPVGFHVGFDGETDFQTTTTRVYGGLSLAVLNGISLTAGVAMLQLQFLPEGFQSGQGLPDGFTFEIDNIRLETLPRWYVGFSLNAELIDTISAVVGVN